MVSKMAILYGLETKWDIGTINGIINGYYQLAGRRIRRMVAKLLHKSLMPIAQLGQCTSHQVGKGLMNMNKHELILLRVARIH